jgi:thiamine biosynthesis lipoprotein
MRHVFETMGTTASLSSERPAPVREIERIFSETDQLFSLYRPASELSRIASGELRLPDASPALVAAYAEALEWRNRTDGAFSPNRPDGVIDLNGIVKATAMRDAARALDESDCGPWVLVVGGDVVASASGSTAPRPIGVTDPLDRAALLCSVVLTADRRAVATSGSAERGDHIWLGGDIRPADFVQVTVIADEIVTADVLATAIVAAGPAGLDDLCSRWPVDVFTVDRAGQLSATPGFRKAIEASTS